VSDIDILLMSSSFPAKLLFTVMSLSVWMRFASSCLLLNTYVNGMKVADFCATEIVFLREVEMATNYSTAKAAEPRPLTALFKNREDADSAYEWLLKNGYTSNDIHLLMSEETKEKYHNEEPAEAETTDKDAIAGIETGAAFGGGLGATLGAIAGIGAAVVIPGMGLAIAGPLTAILAGAGGMLGGALGALFGSSLPEEAAHELEQAIREGSILIRVDPYDAESAALIENEWRRHGGEIVNY
jgi:hypothetical protein